MSIIRLLTFILILCVTIYNLISSYKYYYIIEPTIIGLSFVASLIDNNILLKCLWLFICIIYLTMYIVQIKFPTISIKYFSDIEHIAKTKNGDWIDLRSSEDITLKKGEYKLIPLGVGMKLPIGYEAHIVPRSSTYKNFKIIQTNHQAVIDESYCGNNDQWYYPVYAMENTVIHKNDRICQFRIVKKQPNILFHSVLELKDKNRGGFGSSGIK